MKNEGCAGAGCDECVCLSASSECMLIFNIFLRNGLKAARSIKLWFQFCFICCSAVCITTDEKLILPACVHTVLLTGHVCLTLMVY